VNTRGKAPPCPRRQRVSREDPCAARKDEKLLGTKLLLAEEVGPDGAATGDLHVVADHLGAGSGDVVLISQGSAARFTG